MEENKSKERKCKTSARTDVDDDDESEYPQQLTLRRLGLSLQHADVTLASVVGATARAFMSLAMRNSR